MKWCIYFSIWKSHVKTDEVTTFSRLTDLWDSDLTGAPLRGQEESI